MGTLFAGGTIFAATTYVQAQAGTSKISLNGTTLASPPKLVYGGTTYVQLYSIQHALQQVLGLLPGWDGTTFSMNTVTQNSPENTTKTILTLSQHQQWDVLYGYLDPDVQAKYTVAQFVADRQQNGAVFATVQSFTVQSATMLPTWTDTTGTGKTYTNVADVPLTLTFSGGSTLNASMHLVKAADGTWRYFWSPTA